MSQEYANTITDHVLELLKDKLGDAFFKSYFYSDPRFIADSNLPAVIVDVEETDVASETTAQDVKDHVLVVKLVASKRSEYNKAPSEVSIKRKLEQYAEGIDLSTGRLSLHSVAGILRKHYTTNEQTHGQLNFNISYPDDQIRGETQFDLTREAHIRVAMSVLTVVDRT